MITKHMNCYKMETQKNATSATEMSYLDSSKNLFFSNSDRSLQLSYVFYTKMFHTKKGFIFDIDKEDLNLQEEVKSTILGHE